MSGDRSFLAAHATNSKSNLARPELFLIGGWDTKWSRKSRWFCLWHEHQDNYNSHETHRCHAQQASRIAEPLSNNPSYQRAERSADPGKCASKPLGEVKPAGPVGEIRNNEGRHYAQRCTAESVEQLNDDKQGWIGRQRKKRRAYRHG